LWLRFVTVKSGHNAAGCRKLQTSGLSWLFFSLFVTFFYFLWLFFTFWDGQFLYCKWRSKFNHLWRLCDSLKAVTNKTVIESIKSPCLAELAFLWLFMTFLFLYFSSTYIGCCRRNNYQKHICTGTDWLNKEVGFCPRGSSSLGASKAIDGPPMTCFFLVSIFFKGSLKENSHQSAPVMPIKFFFKFTRNFVS
jgi:hypothetical protein